MCKLREYLPNSHISRHSLLDIVILFNLHINTEPYL